MANTQNTPQDKDLSRFVLATIAELSPCSEKELLEEAASRKCRSVSDFSKLVLRCVQQLRAQGFVELIEERLIITGAGRKHLGAKLSAETIDEVLAHIRQILSKNKSSIEREAATQEGGAVERPTSDDTTRWFRSSSAAAPVEEEEILELTSELGGLELVEDEGEIVVEILDEADILELGEATLELTAEATFPEPLLESEVKPERAPKTETPATPQSDPSETDAPTLLESQETTSALERAIAALRGGQVPTAAGSHSEPFQFQKAPQHESRATSKPVPEQEPALEPAPEPEPVPMAVPEPPKPEAEVHTEAKPGSYAHLNPSFGVEPESSLASETIEEPALVLSGIEMSSRGTEELQISAMDEEGPFPPAQTTTHEESVGNPEGTVGIEPNGQSPSLGPAPQDDHVPGPQMSRFGWLVENIPRRMRAHVPVEAEVRLSATMSSSLMSNLVGQGGTDLHQMEVGQAMSLRLSAPKGGFTIEAQSPETQWVWRDNSQRNDELAAWRFTLTPNRRGSNVLRMTFSYKEIGPNGLLADSSLPDRVFDVTVTTNLAKACARVALWTLTLAAGAALGAYLDPLVRLLARALPPNWPTSGFVG